MSDPAETTPPEGGWIRRLSPYLLAHRRNVTIALAASVVGQGLSALTPVFAAVIIDDGITAKNRPVWPWLVALVVAGLLSFGCAFLRRWIGGRVSLDVQFDLRNAIYERLQRLDFAGHDQLRTGQLVSRASTDLGLVQGLLAFLPIMLGNVVLLVIALVVMVILSPLLTLVVVATLPLLLVVSLRLRSRVFPATWDAQQRAGEVAGVVDEAVTGVRVVKGFGQEERELDHLAEVATGLYSSRARLVRLQAKFTSTLQAIPTLGQVAVLALGGWLALNGQLTLGTFLAFSSYLVQLVAPVRMLAGLFTVGQQARAGAERIFDILDANAEVVDAPDAIEIPPARGEVRFEGVRFGYSRSEPVLDGLDLHVAAGEVVALVGTSGSGKSTVTALLPRFYDVAEGRVTVDGYDVRDLTLESLRRQVGLVFEDAFLFSDTVRANIAYARPDATDAEVEAAAAAAGADGVRRGAARGLRHRGRRAGLTLSGGQRQRLALARAMLTDPRMLVLDDATSAVDTATEEAIHDTLRELMAGRTTILIAHRRSTLRLADRIVVLDAGRVVDEGTHEELLESSSVYRDLFAGPDDVDLTAGDEDLDGEGLGEVAEPVLVGAAITESAWPALADDDVPVAIGLGRRGRPHRLTGRRRRRRWRPDGHGAHRHAAAAGRARHPAPGRRPARRRRRGRRRVGPAAVPGAPVRAAVDALAALRARPGRARHAPHAAGPRPRAARHRQRRHRRRPVGPVDLGRPVRRGRAGRLGRGVGLHRGHRAHRRAGAVRPAGEDLRPPAAAVGLDYYDAELDGRIMTRMTTDVEALSQLVQTGLINGVVGIFTCVGVFVFLIVLSPPLAAVTALVLPPLVLATWWYRRQSSRAYAKAREAIADVNANLQESLSGVRVAQAYVREGRNISGFRSVNSRYLGHRLDAQKLVAMYFPFVLLLSDLATALVLGAGAAFESRGIVTAGTVIAFLLYLNQFFSPIQQLSQVLDTWQQATASIEKIEELLDTPEGTPAPAAPGGRRAAAGRGRAPRRALRLRRRGRGRGAGRRRPAGGAGRDGGPGRRDRRGEVDHREAAGPLLRPDLGLGARSTASTCATSTSTAFRRQLGVVPQEAFLFTGTVRDNIAYGRPEADDAEVEAAARAVGAHDFIASLPLGYRTPVSERGRSLSSGQRQLIALARARLVDPAILLLDEATSQLDLASEARVQRAMDAARLGPHHDPGGPPPAHGPPGRPHRGDRRRPHRRAGHPRRAARRATAATPSCGGPSPAPAARPTRPVPA